jgi:hypothetical protein
MPRYVTLEAKAGGYWLRFEYDPEIVEAIKEMPSYTRRWNPEMRAWWIHEAWIDHAEKIIKREFTGKGSSATQDDEQDVNDYDTFDDFVNGKKREPEPEPPPRTMFGDSLCFATLYLLPQAPLEVAKAAYGALAKLNHPDTTTDPTTKRTRHTRMVEINDAWTQVEKIIKARR